MHPYYLAYVYDDGTVRYSYVGAKQILEVFRLLCQDRTQAYEQLCDIFNDETKNGAEMGAYSDLLKRAIESTSKSVVQRNLAQLKQNPGALLIPQAQQPRGAEQFELITWLVIK